MHKDYELKFKLYSGWKLNELTRFCKQLNKYKVHHDKQQSTSKSGREQSTSKLAQPKKSLFIVGKILIETNEIQNISWSWVGEKNQMWLQNSLGLIVNSQFLADKNLDRSWRPPSYRRSFDLVLINFVQKIQNKYFCAKYL